MAERKLLKIRDFLKTVEFCPIFDQIVAHVQDLQSFENIHTFYFLNEIVRYPQLLQVIADCLQSGKRFYVITTQRQNLQVFQRINAVYPLDHVGRERQFPKNIVNVVNKFFSFQTKWSIASYFKN